MRVTLQREDNTCKADAMQTQKSLTRREFVARCAGCAAGVAAGGVLSCKSSRFGLSQAWARSSGYVVPVKARFFETLDLKRVRCKLCPRDCVVDDMERGYCGVRENKGGVYYTLVHSNPCAVHIDPIEKKPFQHFLPGTTTFSLATAGCNIECAFCQNWQISQARPEQTNNVRLPPTEVVAQAKSHGCKSIAFTYTEPVVFWEYVIDTAKVARKEGIKSVIITNGYIHLEPLKEACRWLDAVKIDFKSFSEKFYAKICHGELAPVLKTIRAVEEQGVWLELVNLVIPGLNDDPDEHRKMCRWIVNNLGREAPIAFTRFYPTYKLKNVPATPVTTLERARKIAVEEGIHYAYVGNVPGHRWEHTYCPKCGEVVIRRVGYSVNLSNFDKGRCRRCGKLLPGVW